MDDPDIVLALYNKLVLKEIFVTPVGYDFLHRLQEYLYTIPYIRREDILPITVYEPEGMVSKEKRSKEEIKQKKKRQKNKEHVVSKNRRKKNRDYQKLFHISTFFAVVFALGIIGMLVITWLSEDNVTILNYENKVIDKYEIWEKQLDERESQYTSSGTYSVTNSGDNTWQVSIQQLVSVLPDAGIVEGSDGSEIEFESDWTASYTIKQETGTQKLTDVRNSIFTVSTSVLNGKTMYLPADQLNVSTPKPFQFNPACSASAPVGNGLMTISLANDDEMMSNYTTAEVMGGDQLNTCFPKIKISYGGYTTEY